MRILVLSNLYPPYELGGYELRCQEVVDQLRHRGHHIWVLTSQYGLDECHQDENLSPLREEQHVFRKLHLRWRQALDIWTLYHMELEDHAHLRRLMKQFHPEAIYVWNCRGLGKSLLLHAQSYRIPLIFHIEENWFVEVKDDYWFNYCDGEHPINIARNAIRISLQKKPLKDSSQRSGSRKTQERFSQTSSESLIDSRPSSSTMKGLYHKALSYLPKEILLELFAKRAARYLPFAPEPIDCRYTCFVSHFRKQEALSAGFSGADSCVIHGGIDTARFLSTRTRRKRPDGQIKILCAARLCKNKGIHTVLDAFSLLLARGVRNISLTISGEETRGTEYTDFLQTKLTRSPELMNAVTFTGKIAYKDMPLLYQEHDVFISASIIAEGFPLTVIEAMASELVVFSTATGGAKEIIRHKENGIVFSPDDPLSLADELQPILDDQELRQTLSHNAQRSARENFDLRTMTANIEHYFSRVFQNELSQ